MWKKWFSVGVLVVLLLTGASAVQARELAGKNFGGKGWNQSDLGASVPVPVSFAGVSRGSISFDLQRTGDIPAGEGETVFALMESAGILALRLQVDWVGPAAKTIATGSASGGRRSSWTGRWPAERGSMLT
jgi:hypothetical protein